MRFDRTICSPARFHGAGDIPPVGVGCRTGKLQGVKFPDTQAAYRVFIVYRIAYNAKRFVPYLGRRLCEAPGIQKQHPLKTAKNLLTPFNYWKSVLIPAYRSTTKFGDEACTSGYGSTSAELRGCFQPRQPRLPTWQAEQRDFGFPCVCREYRLFLIKPEHRD